jgi:undecaprenyl-diphosphatase
VRALENPLGLGAVALAVLLGAIIWLVLSGRADSFDFPLRDTLLGLDPAGGASLWSAITFLGSTALLTGLTILCLTLFALRREWQPAGHLAIVMGGAILANNGLKWIIHRPRPLEVFQHTMPASFSFPSGHSLFSLAFYLSVAIIIAPRLSRMAGTMVFCMAILLILLIGASRIFLGVHYPLDVMGGYTTAALWLVVVRLFERRRAR